MKWKKAAIAVVAAGAAAALSFTAAGAATASPAGHPKHHKPKPKPAAAPQVSGNRLASALLPTSSFGDGWQRYVLQTTGNSLRSTKVYITPARLSCPDFESFAVVGGWGNTAGAQAGITNLNPDFPSFPSITLDGWENVVQFATPKAAASFYSQVYAKYGACPAVTASVPEALGGGTEDLTNQSLAKTTLGKDQAFNLIQSDVRSNFANLTFYQATLVVLRGTNVYTIYEASGTNDPVSPDLMSKLISRTQALYPKK